MRDYRQSINTTLLNEVALKLRRKKITERRRSIGIFNDVMATEAALKELDNSHYSLDRVFVIARNQDNEKKVVTTQLCKSLRDRKLRLFII